MAEHEISIPSLLAALAALLPIVAVADTERWAGEYSDKKFMNGQAALQLSIEQEGGRIQISFDFARNDGGGCAPEAQGSARTSRKDSLQFSFTDNQGNAGTGTLVRKGAEIVVGLKATRKVKPECTAFYRENIHLKRVK